MVYRVKSLTFGIVEVLIKASDKVGIGHGNDYHPLETMKMPDRFKLKGGIKSNQRNICI